ncbi:sulfurtransferase-like selenium metabolism protein YedF [Oceanirhabdus sp. W0125-5]|uniref:sulfurtransferase-like selenium metabolism protein YedF n=1 Tax=Oceanirhabdus sp. W0125-5 TaxID=2999116 RepID=UPI0022F2C189|nr:sulfurtransferase-like selenium metabolism protein YedF [Oceanirhabdus sp. W0125-5]WBW97618.1 sulfurtransferase-like selenium metabolism protein YedF [Oceanirhabdus sp. W0125-5]
MENRVIDCTGLNCPMPVINTKKALSEIEEGTIEVIIDNEIAKANIVKLANNQNMKYDVIDSEEKFIIKITKQLSEEEKKSIKNKKKFTVVIGTDVMGQGSEELGRILIKGYIFALSESEEKPTDIIIYNGGVKLAAEGSNVIESLRKLESEGIKIQVCGTCLEYYKIKDQLKVGEISNMYNIVETMNSSDKVINI